MSKLGEPPNVECAKTYQLRQPRSSWSLNNKADTALPRPQSFRCVRRQLDPFSEQKVRVLDSNGYTIWKVKFAGIYNMGSYRLSSLSYAIDELENHSKRATGKWAARTNCSTAWSGQRSAWRPFGVLATALGVAVGPAAAALGHSVRSDRDSGGRSFLRGRFCTSTM